MAILTDNLLANDLLIKNIFHNAQSVRSLSIQLAKSNEAKLLFLEEAIDEKKLHSFIFEPIQALTESDQHFTMFDLENCLKDGSPVQTNELETCKRGLLDGKAVLIFNHNYAYLIDCSNWDIRSVGVPLSSSVYEGPASGLTEDLSTNLNLMRNYFRSSDLAITTLSVGKHAAKNMAVISVEGKTKPGLVSEVITRLKSINVDDFIVSQIANDALEGKGFLFPRTMTIDRPDACAMALAKGRVVLFVEGSPLAIIAPSVFFHFFQNQDDYLSEFGRFGARPLRYLYFLIATLLPAITVALVRFHLESLPRDIADQLIKTHGTLAPFTIELLFVILLMQIIMDGSYRLPGNTIFAVTFIGTMLISDIATDVSLFHPVTIVIIGVCYITSFPVLHRGLLSPIFFMRITLLIIAHFFGFTGIVLAATALIINGVFLRSLGVPYLYPLLPFEPSRWCDTIFRPSLVKVINQPNSLPFNQSKAAAGRKKEW